MKTHSTYIIRYCKSAYLPVYGACLHKRLARTRLTISPSNAIIPFLPRSGRWKKARTKRTSTAVINTTQTGIGSACRPVSRANDSHLLHIAAELGRCWERRDKTTRRSDQFRTSNLQTADLQVQRNCTPQQLRQIRRDNCHLRQRIKRIQPRHRRPSPPPIRLHLGIFMDSQKQSADLRGEGHGCCDSEAEG